jgi:hypothetical protein
MSQNPYGLKVVCKSRLMGGNVNSVSKPADNYEIGMTTCKAADKVFTKLFTSWSSVPGANHAQDLGGVQITASLKIESYRRIIALTKPVGIIIIEVKVCPYIVSCNVFRFSLCGFKIRSVANSFRQISPDTRYFY